MRVRRRQRTDEDRADDGLIAAGLGLRTREGWVFRHVDLAARPGEVVVVRGSGGTGRSMLLLALTGRARPTTGTLRVAGHDLPHDAAAVRQHTAVARLGDVAAPEPQLTVGTVLRTRARWDHVHPDGADGLGYAFDAAREVTGLSADDRTLVEDLPRLQATLLAVALATLSRPRVLVLDDLDVGLAEHEQDAVWDALARVAGSGCVAVASTARHAPARGDGTVLVELHPDHVDPHGTHSPADDGTPPGHRAEERDDTTREPR